MKRASAAVSGLILAGMLSGCYARQPQQEEHQLSPAVKAAVTAALGPHVTDADLTEFLRSAKLTSRTKQDTEVVAILDEAVNLVRSAAEDDYRAEKYRRDAKSAQDAFGFLEERHTENKAFCATTTDDIAIRHCNETMGKEEKTVNTQRDEARRNAEAAQGYENESKHKRDRAADLVQKLRAELSEGPTAWRLTLRGSFVLITLTERR